MILFIVIISKKISSIINIIFKKVMFLVEWTSYVILYINISILSEPNLQFTIISI